MMAYHLERKDDDNDNDKSPACVLLGSLVRFGVEEPPTRDDVLRTEGYGEANLSGVYRLDNCLECFAKCHQRLTEERRDDNDDKSLLCCVLDHERLQREQETASRRAKTILVTIAARTRKGGRGGGRRGSLLFRRSDSSAMTTTTRRGSNLGPSPTSQSEGR